MSRPSKSQPSQAASPDIHCWAERSRRRVTSRCEGTGLCGSAAVAGTAGSVSIGAITYSEKKRIGPVILEVLSSFFPTKVRVEAVSLEADAIKALVDGNVEHRA